MNRQARWAPALWCVDLLSDKSGVRPRIVCVAGSRLVLERHRLILSASQRPGPAVSGEAFNACQHAISVLCAVLTHGWAASFVCIDATVSMATFGAGLHVEELEYRADNGPDGWVPLRIVARPADAPDRPSQLPVVILLHATGELHLTRWVYVTGNGCAC